MGHATKELISQERVIIKSYALIISGITMDNRTLIGGWSIDITEKKEAEQKVIEHTERLKEIAFLQSHEVRRPLSNILTIVNLLEIKSDLQKDAELIELLSYLKQSSIELDMVIKKIMYKITI